jgi:hypothetical protein
MPGKGNRRGAPGVVGKDGIIQKRTAQASKKLLPGISGSSIAGIPFDREGALRLYYTMYDMKQGECMFAIEGVYDGNAVQVNPEAIPVKEAYEVVVTFIKPRSQSLNKPVSNDDERLEAYQKLMKYKGTLHRHIDYKKELAEARDEKYGRID